MPELPPAGTEEHSESDEEMIDTQEKEPVAGTLKPRRAIHRVVRCLMEITAKASYSDALTLGNNARLTDIVKKSLKAADKSIWLGMSKEYKNQEGFYKLNIVIFWSFV